MCLTTNTDAHPDRASARSDLSPTGRGEEAARLLIAIPHHPNAAGSSVSVVCRPLSVSGRGRARAPHIDAGEQEQPHHIDEVPVPGGEFEAQMLLRSELARIGADQAYDQKDRSDDDMGAMKARRHEEGGAVDVPRIMEWSMTVLVGLDGCEGGTEREGEGDA